MAALPPVGKAANVIFSGGHPRAPPAFFGALRPPKSWPTRSPVKAVTMPAPHPFTRGLTPPLLPYETDNQNQTTDETNVKNVK